MSLSVSTLMSTLISNYLLTFTTVNLTRITTTYKCKHNESMRAARTLYVIVNELLLV